MRSLVERSRLAVTDPASIASAVDAARGVDVLINDAGSATGADLLTSPLAELQTEPDMQFLGSLSVTRDMILGVHGATSDPPTSPGLCSTP